MNTREPADSTRYAAWRAPDPSPDFHARVWHKIAERRVPSPWYAAWLHGRLAYAGACAATVLLWIAVWQAAPPSDPRSAFSAVEPGMLTAALAQATQEAGP